MRGSTGVVEACRVARPYMGHVTRFPGLHLQGASSDELAQSLREMIQMLLEDGDADLEAGYLG